MEYKIRTNEHLIVTKDNLSINIDEVLKPHEYVEIGGLKWATMNIGATAVTDYGLYFQWGDTQGYTASQVGSGDGKKYFGWSDYKYGNGTSSPGASGMTKYNSTDGKTVLEPSDDPVTAAWGGSWRMPTTAEFQALGAAVNSAWTTDYQGSGVKGLVLTDKTDSSKVLFFPAAGHCYNGSVYDVGSGGCYWSSSIGASNIQGAYTLNFFSSSVNWKYYRTRCYGYRARGVCDATYNKNEIDAKIGNIETLVGSGYTNTTITAVIENMDHAVAAAITDLNDKIGDIESILATI